MTISNALLTFIFILFVLFDPNLSKTLQSIKFFFFSHTSNTNVIPFTTDKQRRRDRLHRTSQRNICTQCETGELHLVLYHSLFSLLLFTEVVPFHSALPSNRGRQFISGPRPLPEGNTKHQHSSMDANCPVTSTNTCKKMSQWTWSPREGDFSCFSQLYGCFLQGTFSLTASALRYDFFFFPPRSMTHTLHSL